MSRVLLAPVLVVALAVGAQATITAWEAADDGDGVVTCTTEFESNVLSIDGILHWPVSGQELKGHVLGSFTTDTELDPTVTMSNSIDNDTDFTWTDYHINIFMNKTFTISDAAVTDPSDWTDVSVVQPTWNGSQYVGTIDYYAGTPVPITGTLDFGYKISFVGSVQFCQEMIPTPEPVSLALLSLGGLALIRRRV